MNIKPDNLEVGSAYNCKWNFKLITNIKRGKVVWQSLNRNDIFEYMWVCTKEEFCNSIGIITKN